jgi:hypothetical protein
MGLRLNNLIQLEEWVRGNPIHDHDLNQCCPDFSCCEGDMASEEERKRFSDAYLSRDDEIIGAMLAMFLGRMLTKKLLDKVEIDASKDIIH